MQHKTQHKLPSSIKAQAYAITTSNSLKSSLSLGELVKKGWDKYKSLGELPEQYRTWVSKQKPMDKTTYLDVDAEVWAQLKKERLLGRSIQKRIIHLLALALFEPENLP